MDAGHMHAPVAPACAQGGFEVPRRGVIAAVQPAATIATVAAASAPFPTSVAAMLRHASQVPPTAHLAAMMASAPPTKRSTQPNPAVPSADLWPAADTAFLRFCATVGVAADGARQIYALLKEVRSALALHSVQKMRLGRPNAHCPRPCLRCAGRGVRWLR